LKVSSIHGLKKGCAYHVDPPVQSNGKTFPTVSLTKLITQGECLGVVLKGTPAGESKEWTLIVPWKDIRECDFKLYVAVPVGIRRRAGAR
jgi:hypothetical protein